MKTTIAIDRKLLEKAVALSGFKTKEAVIEAALKVYVQIEQQRQIKDCRGKLRWEGDLNKMRID